MKHKYSKISFICCSIALCSFLLLLAILLLLLIGAEREKFLKLFLVVPVAFGTTISMFSVETLSRYVEFFEHHMRLNSFRFKKMKNAVSLSFKYEDILNISARRLPVIGIWGIKVTAKNLPHAITLSFCFCKHNEMYDNLCKFAKQHNPNVYIDSRLTEFLERKKHD